ncbi:MAG: 1,4-alpha-glucan branching protein GlgB [Lachnospiraceae bacterium]|nr:1,4-alpha-glucan branching protein GlgB [Lachnospiraceae bacterium]
MRKVLAMENEKTILTQADAYVFGQGSHYEIYNKLGAHLITKDGVKGTYFAVWAPHAEAVYVVGLFNEWSLNDNYRMNRVFESGLWEIFLPGIKDGYTYKYLIVTKDGRHLYKADPFASESEMRPHNASVVCDLNGFEWGDGDWIKEKTKEDHLKSKMAIYEVHLGSWRRKDSSDAGFYSYRELAPMLAKYVKDMGYTHVELMGVAEYPFDGSWGYQVAGYYAPTKRYGRPKDFMYFVNYLHMCGIGVIMDWVPAHFPKDEHGLAKFDGEALYEYADPRKGEHPDWGTYVFDYGRNEVANFLIANALFWIEKYHIDGLRVDAVASMLYLDYGRRDGQWIPNKYGGNGNLEAMEFLRHLNSIVNKRCPQAITIAEESTAWPNVSGDVEDPNRNGCLGFTFKWNMGWMHDFLEYMKLDPYFRSNNHNKLTFSTMYAYSENFVLVISHDEVVHLKCSMIEKMPGYPEDKFKNLKAGYAYMLGHPGKKLLFMGQDIAQNHEWDEKVSLDWYLLDDPLHKDLNAFVRRALKLYNSHKSLYETDYDYNGFRWINANDNRSIYSFARFDSNGDDELMFIINFTPVEIKDYMVGTLKKGKYKQVLSDRATVKNRALATHDGECDHLEQYIKFDLQPYEVLVLKPEKGKKKHE